MATTETAENKREIECEVYPGGEFFGALMRMLKERTPIQIAMVSGVTGDIAFTVSYSDLGVTPQMLCHPFCRTHSFANVLGELLVTEHLDEFADRVMGTGRNYDGLVKEFRHREFGLRTIKNELLFFQFHVSLVHHLLNISISQSISDEVAKVILACPKKTKRADENISVATCPDDKSLRLVVAKGSSVRGCFEDAIETILEHYGIKGKEVSVSDNYFNYQIGIKDK